MDPEIVNGVAETAAGLVVIGTTVTEVGTVPPKFKVVAGNDVVAGIVATTAPDGMVATWELGVLPADTELWPQNGESFWLSSFVFG